MDVGMWHFQAHHADPDPGTRHHGFDLASDLFRERQDPGQFSTLQIEEVIHFQLGNHQGMSFTQGAYIQEADVVRTLRELVARDLPLNDAGEDARHDSTG